MRLPLHIQILIALVAGTLIGVLVNPGDVELPDREFESKIALSPAEDGILVSVEEDGIDSLEKVYTRDAFEAAFPSLAGAYQGAKVWVTEPLSVSNRRVHIVEDGKTIAIRYARSYRDEDVVSTTKVKKAADLSDAWQGFYNEHGGGAGRRITIAAKFVGDLFLRLLKMVTIPLIVTSLVTGVAGLGNTSRLGSMFGKTMTYYIATSLLAITTGLIMVNIVQPGVGAELPGSGEAMVPEGEQSLGSIFVGLVDNMIPPNPIQSLANAEFLSIITFSILVGVFIIRTGGKSGEALRTFFNAAFDVMMNLTLAVIRLAPIGVLGFMIFATSTQGLEIFKTLGWYMLAVFLALVVHACVILPLILKFVAKRSPIEYAKAMSPALMTAFSTASSNGTLPLTLNSVEQRAGVSNRVSSFVLPLGATINMDGTALYEAVAVLFIAQATPGFAVTLDQQIIVALTALLASIGAAGIPHAGLVMMAIVLQAVGLPLEAQGIIIAVDRVLDMCRTTVNVWSDSCGCAVLNRFEPAE
ncbi:MAG: dicarboxylate/amino acid:cation symporter [Planctomycetaceae bacterium]|nr:dicarboxylate/amino acid:cation symporter [Planctomycetaceae bacterium]